MCFRTSLSAAVAAGLICIAPAAMRRVLPHLSIPRRSARQHRKILNLRGKSFIFLGTIFLPRSIMPLNIKDPLTEKRVRELAAATGERVTTAVRIAAEERLQRVRRGRGRSLAAELLAIGKRCAALPDLDPRSADEIMDYDEHGLPR